MLIGPKDVDQLGRLLPSVAGLAAGLGIAAAGLSPIHTPHRQEKPKKRVKDRSKIKAARKQRRRQRK